MFMHGGWFHLLGNMWFLHVFGNNVEDVMGRFRFLVFYLLCGLAAAAAQMAAGPSSAIPMVGASGAIGGVMGSYVLLYPRAGIRTFVFLGFWARMMVLPAFLMLGYWFLIQLASGAMAPSEGGGVAFWAHVGGFLAGLAPDTALPQSPAGRSAPGRHRPRMSGLPLWLVPFADGPGLAALIDHTLLRPEATEADIVRVAREAVSCRLRRRVPERAVGRLGGRAAGGLVVRVAAVVGFPLGASGRSAKVAETRAVIADGAVEIDLVMALGWAKGGRWDRVREEITAVVDVAGERLVKVILETAALAPAEVERASHEAVAGGARMVKTSTGFHPAGGATVEAVRLIRSVVGTAAGVKASGGIRTPEDARRMLLAGADRIGTSAAAAWGEALYRRLDEYLAGEDPG